MSKIKYEFNPYTFARISAMKSLLLKKEDYDRMAKMSASEIIKFLQDGVYKNEINALAITYSGIELAENAINRHLVNIFQKLKRISDTHIEFLLNQYLKRYDYYNIDTLLRAKLTNAKAEDFFTFLIPVGELGIDKLKYLYSKGSVREILESSKMIDIKEFNDLIGQFEKTSNLNDIENLLEYHKYLDSIEFVKKIPGEGKLFMEFFEYEFDIYNLKLILKKIFFKLDKKYISNYILPAGKALPAKTINSLLGKDSLQGFLSEINKTYYKKIFSGQPTENTLLGYDIMLDRFLLEKTTLLFHQHPLTVDLILGYMFAKEIEIRNLRILIKSKELEFTESYIKHMIIMR